MSNQLNFTKDNSKRLYETQQGGKIKENEKNHMETKSSFWVGPESKTDNLESRYLFEKFMLHLKWKIVLRFDF